MREKACDVAVIGAGTAGIAAARAARDAGADAVLIEQGPGGTTCARVGCMPSKLLITAANAAHTARQAGQFGVFAQGVRVDGAAVMARLRAERDRFVGSVLSGLDAFPEEARIAGRARFADARTLVIEDHTRLSFRAAVIATGSSPSVPEALRECGDRVLTTDTVFERDTLPETLAVLGGGAVGLELAQAMARLGVAVCLFDPGEHLAGLRDPGLARQARALFGAEMQLHLGTAPHAAETVANGVRLHWKTPEGRAEARTFDRVLVAAGRPPNVRGLGLDETGVSLDENSLPRFDPLSLLCEGAPLFLAGDANGDRPVLHEASRQGGIAGRGAAALARGEPVEAPPRWTDLALVFTEPQVARIGEPVGEGDVVACVDFGDQGRARVMGENAGALHLWAAPDGRLKGAEMLGPDAEHLAHLLAFAIQDGHGAAQLRDRPFYHPTVE